MWQKQWPSLEQRWYEPRRWLKLTRAMGQSSSSASQEPHSNEPKGGCIFFWVIPQHLNFLAQKINVPGNHPKVHSHSQNSPLLVPILRQISPIQYIPFFFFKFKLNITLPSVLQIFPPELCMHPWLDLPNNISWGAQSWSSTFWNLLQPAVTACIFGPIAFFSTLFSITLSLFFP